MNRFKSQKAENKALINNYYPLMHSESFFSVYIFNSQAKPEKDFLRSNIRTKKLTTKEKTKEAKTESSIKVDDKIVEK